jgi:hypothetical protein
VSPRFAEPEAFGAASGKALEEFGRELKTNIESSEVRRALTEQTRLRTRIMDALDEAAKTGTPFPEAIRPILDEADQLQFQTRVAQEAWQLYRAQLDESTAHALRSAEAARAKIEVKNQGEELLVNLGRQITRDPSSLAEAEQVVRDFVQTFAGRMDAAALKEQERRLRNELHLTAVLAAMRIDPKGIEERLQRGEFELDPQQRMQEIQRAQQLAKAQERDRIQEIRDQEFLRRLKSEEARDEWFKAIRTGQAKEAAIIADPRLTAADREHLVSVLDAFRRAQEAPWKDDPVTVARLVQGILAPLGSPERLSSPQPILDALASRKITPHEAVRLHALFTQARNELGETFASKVRRWHSDIQASISRNPIFMMQPMLGAQVANEWERELTERVRAFREGRSKVSEDELLDPRSPHSMVSPDVINDIIRRVSAQTSGGPFPTIRSESGEVQIFYPFGGADRRISPKAGDIFNHPLDRTKALVFNGGDPGSWQSYSVISADEAQRRKGSSTEGESVFGAEERLPIGERAKIGRRLAIEGMRQQMMRAEEERKKREEEAVKREK